MKSLQLLTLPIGTVFLALALVMGRFLPSTNWIDFLEGLFVGLSIALNLSYAFKRSGKIVCS